MSCGSLGKSWVLREPPPYSTVLYSVQDANATVDVTMSKGQRQNYLLWDLGNLGSKMSAWTPAYRERRLCEFPRGSLARPTGGR